MRTASLLAALLLALPSFGAPSSPEPPVRQPCDLVVVAGAALPMDAAFTVRGETAVAVRDGEILAVGDPAEIDALYLPEARIVRAGGVLLPGPSTPTPTRQ